MALSLVEEVKKLQVEEAVALLAEISDGLLKEFNVARGPAGIAGPQGPSGARGPQGPPADTTQIAAAAKDAVREIVAEEMVLCGLVDKNGRGILIQGEPGKDGRDGVSNIPGSVGPQGPAGLQGPKGDTGATGAVGPAGTTGPAGAQGPAGVVGATGSQGSVGPRGPQGEPGQGVTLAQVETLIREIIGTLGDEALRKFVALNQEIQKIANDPRYQRIDGVRRELIGRLTECQEIEEPVRVVYIAPPSTPVQVPPSPPLPATRFERILRAVGLVPIR